MSNRDKILNASLRLFVERGFHGTPIKMIVDSSGVSNGGLFHHFPTKEKIVEELYRSIKLEMVECIKTAVVGKDDTRGFMMSWWQAQVDWALANQYKSKFINMFYNSPYLIDFSMEEILSKFQVIRDRLIASIEAKEIINIDSDFLILSLVGSVDSVIAYLTLYPERRTEDFLDGAFKQFWRSIVNVY